MDKSVNDNLPEHGERNTPDIFLSDLREVKNCFTHISFPGPNVWFGVVIASPIQYILPSQRGRIEFAYYCEGIKSVVRRNLLLLPEKR